MISELSGVILVTRSSTHQLARLAKGHICFFFQVYLRFWWDMYFNDCMINKSPYLNI